MDHKSVNLVLLVVLITLCHAGTCKSGALELPTREELKDPSEYISHIQDALPEKMKDTISYLLLGLGNTKNPVGGGLALSAIMLFVETGRLISIWDNIHDLNLVKVNIPERREKFDDQLWKLMEQIEDVASSINNLPELCERKRAMLYWKMTKELERFSVTLESLLTEIGSVEILVQGSIKKLEDIRMDLVFAAGLNAVFGGFLTYKGFILWTVNPPLAAGYGACAIAHFMVAGTSAYGAYQTQEPIAKLRGELTNLNDLKILVEIQMEGMKKEFSKYLGIVKREL